MSEFFIFSRLNYLCFSLPACLKLSSEGFFFPYLQQTANIINSHMSVFPRQTSCKTSSPLSSAQAPQEVKQRPATGGQKQQRETILNINSSLIVIGVFVDLSIYPLPREDSLTPGLLHRRGQSGDVTSFVNTSSTTGVVVVAVSAV